MKAYVPIHILGFQNDHRKDIHIEIKHHNHTLYMSSHMIKLHSETITFIRRPSLWHQILLSCFHKGFQKV